MSGLSLETGLPNLKFVPSAVLEQTDRQTDGNRPIRDDSVVNGDHAHLLDTRHQTYDIRHAIGPSSFIVFQCVANAVHWTDNKKTPKYIKYRTEQRKKDKLCTCIHKMIKKKTENGQRQPTFQQRTSFLKVWRHIRRLVSWCVFTRETLLPNFCPIEFEMTEP